MVVEELKTRARLRRGDLGLLATTRKLKMLWMMDSLGDGWMSCEEKKKMIERDWGGSALRVRYDDAR